MNELAAIALVALTIGPPIWIYAKDARQQQAARRQLYQRIANSEALKAGK